MIYCRDCRSKVWFDDSLDLAFCINPSCSDYSPDQHEEAIAFYKRINIDLSTVFTKLPDDYELQQTNLID